MKKNNILILLAVIFCLLSVFTACDTGVNPAKITRGGYGRISVNCAAGEAKAARTVFPSTAFDKYEYTFTKAGETAGTKKEPGDDGLFTLELGTYTVTVEAFIDNAGSYIPAASGTSASFSVGPGDNAPVEVRLSAVGTLAPGKLSYTITCPEDVVIDSITLYQWPDKTATDLDGVSGTLELAAGSYLLTVKVSKDGHRGGRNEAIRIYPGLTTVYTADFKENDLLKLCAGIAELKTLLAELPANNTADDEPYVIALMNVSDIGSAYSSGSLRAALQAEPDKYVYLDLSGSTFTTIGYAAFSYCTSLTGITIPNIRKTARFT